MTQIVGASKVNPVRLDWKAYFYNFVELHGEPETQYNEEGQPYELLFADGWRYSAMDYQGPETKPPEDKRKLKQLQLVYWTQRSTRLQQEAENLERQIKTLGDWSEQRELPLQSVRTYRDRDDNGQVVLRRGEPENLDLTSLEDRLDDLTFLLQECTAELRKLNKGRKPRG